MMTSGLLGLQEIAIAFAIWCIWAGIMILEDYANWVKSGRMTKFWK